MKFTIAFLLLAGVCTAGFSQTRKRENVKVRNQTFTYHVMKPVGIHKGILILLPGFGENPQSLFKKTNLPAQLAKKGFITIVPELRQVLYADNFTKAEIDEIIKLQSKKHKMDKAPVFIGGLSAGGSVALSYAEYVQSTQKDVNLKGAFAIDPPLDLGRLYASAEAKAKYPCSFISKEGFETINYLNNTFGGSPQKKPEMYLKHAVFTADAADGGNARFLRSIPVRLYCEPDLDFVRKKYCANLKPSDINAYDLEKLDAFLSKQPGAQCEYIKTQSKGFHSWNILDPENCINWISKIIGQ